MKSDYFGYVYKTTNLIDGKIYVGQHMSPVFDERYLGSGRLLWDVIEKYGKDAFTCEVVCWCRTPDELNEFEIKYIAEFDSCNPEIGYNLASGGVWNGFRGCKHTEEYKEFMRTISIGRTMPEEVRRKIGKANRGKVESRRRGVETRRLSGGYQTPHSDDALVQMGVHLGKSNVGRKRSEDAKRKIAEGNRGKVVSSETREKLRVASSGRSMSDDAKRKRDTPEWRAALSASLKRYHENKRNALSGVTSEK